MQFCGQAWALDRPAAQVWSGEQPGSPAWWHATSVPVLLHHLMHGCMAGGRTAGGPGSKKMAQGRAAASGASRPCSLL